MLTRLFAVLTGNPIDTSKVTWETRSLTAHLFSLPWIADRMRAPHTFHPLTREWTVRLYDIDDRRHDVQAVPLDDGSMVQFDDRSIVWT